MRASTAVLAVALCGCEQLLGVDFDRARLGVGVEAPPVDCITSPPGAECGSDGLGVCNAAGACLGPKVRLAAMFHHTCALMHDGSVWCWGENEFGELGDGTLEFSGTPKRIEGVPPSIAIAAGEGHNCTITEDHQVYCFGNNFAGQCGVEPTPEPTTPVRVTALEGVTIDSISAGRAHTCALSSEEGRVYCWGYNTEGQCGAFPQPVLAPTQVANLDKVVEVQSIKAHNCARRTATPVMVCWGRNARNQLGPAAGNEPSSWSPVEIALDNAPQPVELGLSFDSTYTVVDDGRIFAWGYNARGQLGVGPEPAVVPQPHEVLFDDPLGPRVVEDGLRVFRTDGSHQCAQVLTPIEYGDSRFICWGADDHGELGRGMLPTPGESFDVAQPASAIPDDAIELVWGEDHGCAVVPSDGYDIWCWGRGGFVGDGRVPPSPGVELSPQLAATRVEWPSP